MAKILRNIDKIITGSGTEVDLDNIQASGSGGTVSADGLAITRAEDSDSIDYSFNVGHINTQEADGHSTSATEMLIVGGWIGGANSGNFIDKLSFSDNSATNSFGTLSYSTSQQAAGSDGATLMTCGGGAGPTYLDTCSKISFNSGTEEAWDKLTKVKNTLGSGASTGTELMVNGGYTGGSWYIHDCEKKSFADNTIAVDHGALTVGGRDGNGAIGISGDVTDGTDCLMIGAYSSGGLSTVIKKGFADGSVNELWANVSYASYGAATASNKTNAVCMGGVAGTYLQDISSILFADKSTAESWGLMEAARHGAASSSNGGDKIVIAKGYNHSYQNHSEHRAFDSNSGTLVSSGLSNGAANDGHGSGN